MSILTQGLDPTVLGYPESGVVLTGTGLLGFLDF
jgi:hypothetical protein